MSVKTFIEDIIKVQAKHGLSLGHQDHHGAFVVYEGHHKYFDDWLRRSVGPKPFKKNGTS